MAVWDVSYISEESAWIVNADQILSLSLSLSQFISIQGLLFFFSSVLLSFFFHSATLRFLSLSLSSFLSVSQFHLHLSLCRFFLLPPLFFSIKVFILGPSPVNSIHRLKTWRWNLYAPYALTACLNCPNPSIVTLMIFHFSTTLLSVSFRIWMFFLSITFLGLGYCLLVIPFPVDILRPRSIIFFTWK